MIRPLILCGALAAALAVGGCTWRFDPPLEDASSPMDRMDRAEASRQRTDRTHPDCRPQRRETSREDQERLREVCDRLERDR